MSRRPPASCATNAMTTTTHHRTSSSSRPARRSQQRANPRLVLLRVAIAVSLAAATPWWAEGRSGDPPAGSDEAGRPRTGGAYSRRLAALSRHRQWDKDILQLPATSRLWDHFRTEVVQTKVKRGLTPLGAHLKVVVLAALQHEGICDKMSQDWRGLLFRWAGII